MLNQDPVLDQILLTGVRSVAKRRRSLGNIMAPSVLKPTIPDTWPRPIGGRKCGVSRWGVCCKNITQAKTSR